MSERETSLAEQLTSTRDGRRRFLQERATRKAADYIESLMEEKNVTRAELAELLGRSRGWVTQLLDGDRNRTIRTVADVLAVLDTEMEIGGKPFGAAGGQILAFSMAWHPEFSEWPALNIVTEPQVA